MAHLYLNEELTAEQLRAGHTVQVTGDEARHAVRVSRLRSGEQIFVGNGSGIMAEGTVRETTPDMFSVSVERVSIQPEPTPRVWLVQALAKGDRAERAVEQATEFGVSGVIPWQAQRSIVRWNTEKARRNEQKWLRIAREASKQSLRAWVPAIRPLCTTQHLAEIAQSGNNHVIVLNPRADMRLSDWAKTAPITRDIYVCVGPEGGLSEDELRTLTDAGAVSVTLGREVLRTSSAGPAALAVLNLAIGRW